ncbi:MAG: MBL fold metallo-hydrolase [Candidatus Anstonellales archaeon]
MKLFCGGAGREVGRSHFVVDYNGLRFGLDAGIKVLEDRSIEYPVVQDNLKFLILSHAHMDHSGYVPALASKIPLFLTKPTLLESEHMWIDAIKVAKLNNRKPDYSVRDIKTILRRAELLDYNLWNSSYGIRFMALYAGHLLGAAMINIEIKDRTILYTGDFKYKNTELLRKADNPPDADVLIIESTYWYQNHPDRKSQIDRIYEVVDQTLDNGGVALFPAFSLGRTQELISILVERYKNRVPIYVDGLGKKINRVYKAYYNELNDSKFISKLNSIEEVENNRKRSKITDEPAIIISSSGMLEGGPALYYVFNLNRKSRIILTGYQVKQSNGYRLINFGKIKLNDVELKVDLPVYNFSLSAHADREDILNFIDRVQPEKIILVHSDSSEIFEEELRSELGYDARSIGVGEWLDI